MMPVFPQAIIVTDQEIDISHFSEQEKNFVLKFLEDILALYQSAGKPRIVVAIAGPSGSGKSLLAALAATIAKEKNSPPVTHISIDAFHYPNKYLEHHLTKEGRELKEVKGRYDTYDVPLLAQKLELFIQGNTASFPEYSRKLHEPIVDAVTISGPAILLVEGLWLLFEAHDWSSLRKYFSKIYFLNGESAKLRRNTVERHVRGGRTPEEAQAFYERSDAKNYDLVMQTQDKADAQLKWPE